MSQFPEKLNLDQERIEELVRKAFISLLLIAPSPLLRSIEISVWLIRTGWRLFPHISEP